MAKQLAAAHGADVVVFDRFNVGLSDRTAFEDNGPDLWTRQIGELLERLGAPAVHVIGVSFGSLVAAHFAAKYPKKVVTFAMVSPVLGGLSAASLESVKKARKLPKCLVKPLGKGVVLKKVPALLDRCREQLQSGAAPSGLKAAELMYRCKGTALGFLHTFRAEPLRSYHENGAPDLCKAIAKARIPVFARTYAGDSDVDPDKWNAAWALLTDSGVPASRRTTALGTHHSFYRDDTVNLLAAFFAGDAAPPPASPPRAGGRRVSTSAPRRYSNFWPSPDAAKPAAPAAAAAPAFPAPLAPAPAPPPAPAPAPPAPAATPPRPRAPPPEFYPINNSRPAASAESPKKARYYVPVPHYVAVPPVGYNGHDAPPQYQPRAPVRAPNPYWTRRGTDGNYPYYFETPHQRQGLLAAPSDNYNDHRSISASLRRAASARY